MDFKFLKPNIKKIVLFFLIIITPYFLYRVSGFSLRFFILERLANLWVEILLFPPAYSLGFFGYNFGTSSIIITIFILLAEILFLYVLSCLIIDKGYAKKAAIIFVLFIFLLIVIPNIGISYISMEKTIPQISKIEDIYVAQLNQDYPYIKFQELTVQNNFFLPTMYKLSDDTVCHYYSDGNLHSRGAYWDQVVIINNKKEIRSIDATRPIMIAPYSKKKFYFGKLEITAAGNSEGHKHEFNGDYFLFTNVGLNNETHCVNGIEKDATAKIIISD